MKVKVKYKNNRKIKKYKINNYTFTRGYNNLNKRDLLAKKIELKTNKISLFKYDSETKNFFTVKFSDCIKIAIENNVITKNDSYKYYYYFELIEKICVGIMKNRLIDIKNIFFDMSDYHKDKKILLLIVEFYTKNGSSYRELIYLEDIWAF